MTRSATALFSAGSDLWRQQWKDYKRFFRYKSLFFRVIHSIYSPSGKTPLRKYARKNDSIVTFQNRENLFPKFSPLPPP